MRLIKWVVKGVFYALVLTADAFCILGLAFGHVGPAADAFLGAIALWLTLGVICRTIRRWYRRGDHATADALVEQLGGTPYRVEQQRKIDNERRFNERTFRTPPDGGAGRV